MARKASENKTGVAEQATAAEEKTTAAESAVPATENDKQTSADSAIENTGDTGVDNETVTAGNEAEEKTTDSETGDTSGETETSSDGADGNPDATDDETGETDGTDDEADDISGEKKQQPDAGKGVRFNVAPDGLVEVISEKRAVKLSLRLTIRIMQVSALSGDRTPMIPIGYILQTAFVFPVPALSP